MMNKYKRIFKIEYKLRQFELDYSSIRKSTYKFYFTESTYWTLRFHKFILSFSKLPF